MMPSQIGYLFRFCISGTNAVIIELVQRSSLAMCAQKSAWNGLGSHTPLDTSSASPSSARTLIQIP